VDAGVSEGDEVPPYYDSLLAKLIAWGTTRDQALEAMAAALAEFRVAGVRTTIPFHRRVMADPEFRRGEIDTHSVERMLRRDPPESAEAEEIAALVAAAHLFAAGGVRAPVETPGQDPWTLAARRGMAGRSPLREPWAGRQA
jgi:acetyl/propionyl-CoA carboxylase alpha subunit